MRLPNVGIASCQPEDVLDLLAGLDHGEHLHLERLGGEKSGSMVSPTGSM
jgi:hypothetical protein